MVRLLLARSLVVVVQQLLLLLLHRQLLLLPLGGGPLASALVLELDVALPPGAQDPVPDGEEGLREVGLDAPALVMDIVVGRVVARDVLKRVPGERVAAVVVDRFHHGPDEEEHAHAGRHHRDLVGQTGAQRVEEEALDRVVVQGAVGVRDVETVVTGVEFCCRDC